LSEEDKIKPLTRPDGGLAFTLEDRAWQIYRFRTFGMSDDEIKEKGDFTSEEFEMCAAMIPALKNQFEARLGKGEKKK